MTTAWLRLTAVLLSIAAASHGQSASRPSFEVAAIHPTLPASSEAEIFVRFYNGGLWADPAWASFTGRTLSELISSAYRVKSFQVSAPEWTDGTRYDISAKIPAGVSADLIPEMLQSLLEDRFKLRCHWGSKDYDVYVLSAAEGGVKIPAKPADYQFTRNGPAMPQTMESLATDLSHAMGRPVQDQTGLQGSYMVPANFRSMVMRASIAQHPEVVVSHSGLEIPSASEIRQSLQALGLSLRLVKQSLPLLVVDSAEKQPTEN